MVVAAGVLASVPAPVAAGSIGGNDEAEGAPKLWCTSHQTVELEHDGGQYSSSRFVQVFLPGFGGELRAENSGRAQMEGWHGIGAHYDLEYRLYELGVEDSFGDNNDRVRLEGPEVGEWVEFDHPDFLIFTNYWMPRVVTLEIRSARGKGTGLEWTSQISSSAGLGEAPVCSQGDIDASETDTPNGALKDQCGVHKDAGDPIDTRTGNLYVPLPGIGVAGRGAGLGFGLMYNSSRAGEDGLAGFGWSSTLAMRVRVDDADSVTVVQETGATVPFTLADGVWTVPDRFSATLEELPGGGWVFTRKHFEVFEFDSAGRLAGAGDQFDNMTTITYDSNGLADFMEDEAGRRLDFGWNDGRLVSVSDDLAAPAGPRSVQLAYNGAGELTSFTDVGGGVWSFTYLGGHLLGDVRDPRHHGGGPDEVVRNTYDHLGRVVAQVDEEGQTMRLDYFTPEPEWTTVTLPSGMQRIDRYADGLCVGRTYAPGTALEQQVDFVRDPGTLVLDKVTNAAGEETLFESDERGNRIKATDASGRVTRWTYNSFDQVTSVSVGETAAPLTPSTANVVTSTVAYNADGLPTAMVDAAGTAAEATTTFTYDTTHREDLVAVVDGRGKEWSYGYDPDTGDLLEAVDPVGGSSTMAYNGIGWLTAVVAPKGNETGATPADWTTAIEHDDWGRVVAEIDPLGSRVETTFDANGNVVATETGLSATVTTGDVTTYAYDAVDRLTTVDPPGPGARSYSYDPDGRRTGFVNELGGTWAYAYDDLGRLVSQTAPESLPSVYSWDEASRLVSVTQPGGNCAATPAVDCITYSYDPAGRPTGVDYSDPATPDITGIAYDAVGRRTAATRAGDTQAWAWDARSRLVSHTDVNGRATTYGWDDTGNLVSIGYPGQSTPLTRAFDDAGQMVSVTDWASRTTTFDYDGNGNWESTVFPTSSQNSDIYSYDRADRMVGVTWKRGTAVLGSLAYAPRDAKGLVTSVTGTGTASSTGQVWDYDTRDRLVDTGSEEFGFDAATNLVDADGVLQVFDPAQRLCWTSETDTGGDCGTPPADATTYGFDERGNRTSMTYPSGTTGSYGFDAENRMTSAVLPSANWDTETRQFVTLTPARIADTTTGAGTCDGAPCAPLVADDPVAVTVAGAGGVPATGATAVALTVTVTDPVGDGWLSINPVGDAAAGVVALSDGQATTLNVVAKLDTNGTVTVVSDVGADVAVDVTGYFKVASGWVPALNYWPVTPALAADSTSGTGTCDGAPCGVVPAGETDVTVAGVGGIPTTGAAAVTVTVIGQNPTGGRLRAAPNGDASAGDISWDAGSAGASGSFTVPVNPDGTITIEVATATTLRLSVTGYWKLPTGTDTGLGLDLLDAPARLVDTTDATGTCNPDPCDRLVATAPVVIDVAGQADLDEDISAVMVAITVIDPAATGLVGISPDGVEYPGIMLFDAGQNVSASMIVPVDPTTGTITVVAWAATDLAIDVIGSFTQPTRTWRYDYDTSGLRSAKELVTADGTGVEARQEHTWTAAGGLPLLLAEHQGAATSYLVYGPGGTPIYQINHTGEAIYLHQDHQGSTRLVTNANGTVRGAMAYDAHGAITVNTNPWYLQQPMAGYTGQYHDTETGYIYLRARHYDPVTGQFTSQDPLVAITNEPYGYVGGNPANGSDPTGLWEFELPIEVAGVNCVGSDCESIAEQHPEATQEVVDFSSGVLDVNPITATTNSLGISDTSQHADRGSGWYLSGRMSMAAVNAAGAIVSPGYSAGLTYLAVPQAAQVCLGLGTSRSSAKCSLALTALYVEGQGAVLGRWWEMPFWSWSGSAGSALMGGFIAEDKTC
jgi:RHS repeat-associated protein